MEKLHDMLVEYNINYIPKEYQHPWSIQFQKERFPKYWELIYEILRNMNKSLRVIEIGAGQGDITSILCYLGFKNIISYERNDLMCHIAERKIQSLFHRTEVVVNKVFPDSKHVSDVLIIANCVYADDAKDKTEYKNKLRTFYDCAGSPETVILEVIDSSYTQQDPDFPDYVRLSQEDIYDIFPVETMDSYETYHFPKNKRTKYLYKIRTKH